MYTKFQIALQYFPDLPYATASRRLRQYISDDKPLQEALFKTGYRPAQKHFTMRQTAILREYLGDP